MSLLSALRVFSRALRKPWLRALPLLLILIFGFQNCGKALNADSMAELASVDISQDPETESPVIPSPEINTPSSPMSSAPQLLKVLKTNGTLVAGKTYIYWRDPVQKLDMLSDLSPGGFSGTSNFSDDKQIVLWGAGYEYNAQVSSQCLLRNGECEVSLLGPLFRRELVGLQSRFDAYVSNLPILIDRLMAQSTGKDSSGLATCTSKGFVLRYPAIRSLALTLQSGARLHPYIYETSVRQKVGVSLTAAANTLKAIGAAALLRSDYNDCYNVGGVEPQTLFMAIQALRDWSQVTGTSEAGFFAAAWMEIESSPLLDKTRDNVLTLSTPVPNAFAQYVFTASALQAAGVDALQSDFTATGIQQLFQSQALDSANQIQCPGVVRSYGGWFHYRQIDCAEKMGYHLFIVDALLTLHSYLKTGPGDSSYWTYTKNNIPYNLAAALAWVINVQDTSGGFWDQAPSSTSDKPTLFGTSSGIMAATRIDQMLRSNGFAGTSAIKVGFEGQTLTLDEISNRVRKAVQYDLQTKSNQPAYLGDFLKADLQQRLQVSR